MIISKTGNLLRLVSQPDHARLAADILSLWRRDGLVESDHRDDLLYATSEHDNGWLEADSAPRVNPASGWPFDYRGLPDGPRQEIWRRGIERWREDRPFASLLIVEHAIELHRTRSGGDWDEFLEDLRRARSTLVEETGVSRSELEPLVAHLRLVDRLSLEACSGSSPAWRQSGYRISVVDELTAADQEKPELVVRQITIDPLPLAGETTFEVASRQIPDRHYKNESDLASVLARARWERTQVRIGPVSS